MMTDYLTNGSLALQEELPISSESTFYKDGASESFSDMGEMLDFISERESNAYWIAEQASKLRLNNLELGLAVQERYDREGKRQIIQDTLKNTKMFMTTYGKDPSLAEAPIRTCAIPTILDRAKISGTALSKVSTDTLVYIVNECLKVAIGDTKLRIADGKVSAALSMDYTVLPMPQLFETAATVINSRFRKNHFAGGVWSHSAASANWELTDENALIQTYTNALDRHGVKHEDIQPAIRLSSSDIGVCGANLMPKLFVGKESLPIPLGGSISLHHKNGANMTQFRENLGLTFSQFGSCLSKLAHLLDIEIDNAKNCMTGVMKRLGIPKKYGMPVIEMFVAKHGAYSCTAHDIYYGLGEVLFLMQMNRSSGEQMLRMEENIARALVLNFDDYDLPGEMA